MSFVVTVLCALASGSAVSATHDFSGPSHAALSVATAPYAAVSDVDLAASALSVQSTGQNAGQSTGQTPGRNTRPSAETEYDLGEIEVVAQRPRGSVIGDIEPEIVFTAEELQAYGATTVGELLTILAPLTQSSRGRGDAQPVTLLNGRRISGFNEIRGIPFEAIERTEILPEEAALAYGYSADQRVVNIVLKPSFQQSSAQITARAPERGGRSTTEIEGNLFRLQSGDRWNFELKRQRDTVLFESERDIVRDPGAAPYDLTGNITGLTPGAEIDPALSALVGSTVTGAAVPSGLTTPGLADFAAGAGQFRTDDLTAWRSLMPSGDSTTLNASLARDLNSTTQGSVTLRLEDNSSRSFLGLPQLALTLPGASPYSPFAGDVRLYRYADVPMVRDSENLNVNLGVMLDGYLGEWRWNFNGALQRNESKSTTDRGFDASAWQADITAGTANPFAAVPTGSLIALRDTSRSVSTIGSAEAVFTGSPWRLPAGDVLTTIKVGADARAYDSESTRSGVFEQRELSRERGFGTVNLSLPIASRSNDVLSALGDLTLGVNAGYEDLSDFGGLSTVGLNLNWSPVTPLSLILSYTREQGAPSVEQLNSPVVATPLVPVYDFATGRTVMVTRTTGGNSTLGADTRDVVKFGVNFRPFEAHELRFSSNYTWSRTDDEIASFPSLTPALEAALPGRFTRDTSGVLIAIDARPLNYAWTERQDIRTGLTFSRAFGTPNPAAARPQGGPRGGAGAGPGGRPGGGPGGGPGAGPGGGPGGGMRVMGMGGPPPGGGGPGGGGRGGGAAMQPGQGMFNISVFHTYRIQDEILIGSGLPVIDQLAGASTNARGTPRNELQVQGGVFRNGFGGFFNLNWREGTTISGGGAGSDIAFSDRTTVNLNLFADLNQRTAWVERFPILRGARISMGVENLFDSRVEARSTSGALPLNYQPDFLDPQGRVFRVSLRKILF